MPGLARKLEPLIAPVLDMILPHACHICGAHARQWICPQCQQGLGGLCARPSCGYCAYPLAMAGDPCPRCLGRPGRVIQRLAALGLYSEPLRSLILHMKFRRKWPLCYRLGERLREHEHTVSLLCDADLLVPIPLHWRHHISRGFNQSELICDAIRTRSLHVCHALTRTRLTGTQSRLHSRFARARNVRGSFAPTRHAAKIAGKRILLVDDVFTTGSTVRAAANALRSLRPASVNVLVLAIADPRQTEFAD